MALYGLLFLQNMINFCWKLLHTGGINTEEFKRDFYKTEHNRHLGIEQLKKMPWFEFLKKDVERGEVFPALRYGGDIHFYYQGARICKYTGNMNGAPKATKSGKPFNPVNQEAYEEIKRKCRDWAPKASGEARERAALSRLYSSFSPYVQPAPSMILLDMEIGFPRLYNGGKKIHDNIQIDLLFLDKSTGTLYFIEAKEAGDSRIKGKETASKSFDSSEVAEQLNKYNDNLAKREGNILSAYQNHLNIMREIFNCVIYSGELKLYGYNHDRAKLLIYGKSSSDDLKSRKEIQTIKNELDNDLIVIGDGLENVDDLPKLITGNSSHNA